MAMVNYFDVAKGVEPKRRKVAEAEKNLRLAQRDLATTKEQLAALNAQLAELRQQFGDKTTEQQVGWGLAWMRQAWVVVAVRGVTALQAQAQAQPLAGNNADLTGTSLVPKQELRAKADLMERRLGAAERLIDGLGSEKERWAADITLLEASHTQLVGDCLLCSSFLSYTGWWPEVWCANLSSSDCSQPCCRVCTGAFTHSYRCKMVYELWQADLLARRVPLSQPFRLEAIMTSDVETTAWASEGLPGDELSVQNGILTARAARWPLCIDPQMQAVTWIKAREGKALDGKVRACH
jgi:dynein heavy chain